MSIWPILVYLAVGCSLAFSLYVAALWLYERLRTRSLIRRRLDEAARR